MDKNEKDLKSILEENHPAELMNKRVPAKELGLSEWVEIRLFISSTFIDTHFERDILIKKIIPALNRELKDSCITIVPIDLRWGVLKEDSKNCHAIQRTCLDEIDHCRLNKKTYPYFLGLRTQRYGWVQDDLMSSDKYNQPELFGWIEALKKYKKKLSITSLECIHSVWLAKEMPPAPTAFFYEREILNPENIEEEFRWIFDFEYKDEDMGYQYVNTAEAGIYAEDKEKLNEYLKSLGHVRYTEYKCSYEKGGARITGNNKDKKFGIGYVKDVEDFENKVKADLLSSIKSNFQGFDFNKIPSIERNNLRYKEAMKEKASTFVERITLTNQVLTYCTSTTVTNNVMIVKGEPGHGKSALVAFVASKCMENKSLENTFVFIHGVDTCPRSSDLEQMLLRLHDNLCSHIGTENTLKNSEDLKSKHVSQLEEIVSSRPEQRFIIFVDAVNQLHDSMQAHRMWWLPSEATPKNLRFVISTLPDENNTFANAKKQCPNAEVISVEEMTQEEGKTMVSTILSGYNKKLTTDDSDGFLGNQMQLLLDKNCKPLYLSAACEALRTFGVYEELTKEIEKFPATVPELFSYLIDRWSNEYGDKFICYLMCVITLSRDGLPENMISDILRYIKKKMSIKFKFTFSHVFSSIRGFLASGGGGNLRLFHDQLNQVVRERYLNPSQEFAREIHEILAGFYLEQIQSQLCEKPLLPPSLYHSDCLRHVVHHQSLAMKNGGQLEQFEPTLRNVFFVREKIKDGQLNELMKEYSFSLQYATDETMKSALQIWKKFVTVYAPFIKELPQWSHNMAINQIPSSQVYKDTKKLNVETKHCELFPTYWTNKPSSEQDDHVLLKYRSGECKRCATTNVEDDMVALCFGDDDRVWVYGMKTCEFLAQVKMKNGIYSMTFSNENHLLLGDRGGFVHIFDISTGKVDWSSEKICEGEVVVWLQHVNDNVICGSYEGTVASICTTKRTITTTWKTGEKYTWVYHYHHTSEHLYTGHKNSLKCWKLNGVLVRSLNVEGDVNSLDVHPTKENVVVCGIHEGGKKVVQLNMLTGEVMWEVKELDVPGPDVVYTHDGERVVCVDRTLILLDGDGNITNKVKGHKDKINSIKLVPGTHQLLTAGRDGSYLFNLPKTPDEQYEDNDMQYEVISCAALSMRNEIIVLKCEMGYRYVVERCHGDSLQTLTSVEVKVEGRSVVAHPTNDNLVVVLTPKALLFLDSTSLETVAKHKVLSNDKSDQIFDFIICNNGTKCVVLTVRVAIPPLGTSVVYDITNINVITTLATLKMGNYMNSSDINTDGSKVVCGSYEGMVLYDVSTALPIKTLREKSTDFVRFIYQPDGVLFVEGQFSNDYKLQLMNFEGEITHSYPGKHYLRSPTLLNTKYLLTGNEKDKSIQVIDIATPQTVYKFYHPSSTCFKSFAYHPEHNKLFAVNCNGKLYVLE